MPRRRRTNKELPQRMYLRSGSYYFVEYETNKWINLGRDFSKAMAEYGRIRGPSGPIKTLNDLLDRYLTEISPTKAKSSYENNLIEAKYLRVAFGSLKPSSIESQAIYAYLDHRGKSSKARANREVALLSHMYTKAIRWGVAKTNPCRGVERFKLTPRKRYVDDQELEAFTNYAGEFIAAYCEFKVLTGLRQGDILQLRLNQLKDDGIHVTISKTDTKIIYEWTDALRASVARLKGIKRPISGLYLLCTRKGSPYTRDGFKSIWQRKMTAALADPACSLVDRFTEHDLRTKTASDTSLSHAKELLGHADERTTKRHYRAKAEVVKPIK